MKCVMVSLSVLAAVVASATSFSYQGVLRNATGGAVEGKNQVIAFRLYDSPNSETALWGRSSAVLLDDNGLFNIELGDATGTALEGLTNSLDSVISAQAGGTLYIGLTVSGSSGEIRPRQKVLSVPLASYAQDVALAKQNFTVTGQATMMGALTVKGKTDIEGKANLRSLSVQNGATLAGETKVTGTLNISGGRLEMPAGSAFTIGGASAVIPSGVIVMWSGSVADIPTGWVLCDGQNGTPDLRGRFIVGAGGAYGVGNHGGAETVTLTEKQIPPHNHSYEFKGADINASWDSDNYFYNQSERYSSNNNKRWTNMTGGGEAHENRPPYWALCYIMKTNATN